MVPPPLTCTRCGATLPTDAAILASLAHCPVCQVEMRAVVFPALGRPVASGAAPQPVLEDGEAACFYHPDKRAVVPCDGCGRFLCALCDIEMHGKHLCPACLDPSRPKPGLPSLERGRTRYDHILWSMLIIPLLPPLCFTVTPFTAAGALVLALWKWRAPPSQVDNTRLRLALGMVLAVVELAAVAWFWRRSFFRS